jgi:hypothetical protein
MRVIGRANAPCILRLRPENSASRASVQGLARRSTEAGLSRADLFGLLGAVFALLIPGRVAPYSHNERVAAVSGHELLQSFDCAVPGCQGEAEVEGGLC